MKFSRVGLAILLVAAAIALLSAGASASEVGLSIKDSASGNDITMDANPFQMCPGSMTAAKDVSVVLSNIGPATDTYQLSLKDLPQGWTGQIQQSMMLGSGESKPLDLFIMNNYQANPAPGKYSFKITAQSLTDARVIAEKRVWVEILPCHGIELSVDPPSRDVCKEIGGSLNYTVLLRNSGKFNDDFDITVSSQSAVSQQKSVSLGPNQSSSFMVAINSAGLSGQNDFYVGVKSRSSSASANATVRLNAADCYSSEASLLPSEASGCIGRNSTFKLLLKNTGNYDTFSLSYPSWASSNYRSFILDRNQSKEIEIIAGPAQAGKANIEVSISSSDVPSVKKVSASLDMSECRDIVTLASPASSSVCKGGSASFDIIVKNRGTLEDTITVSSSAGKLSANKLTLPAGQGQTIKLSVDSSGLAIGKNAMEITATDGKVSDKSAIELLVESCYSSAMEILPSNRTVCPSTGFNYTVRLTNTGKFSDSFKASFKGVEKQATLEPGKSTSWDIPVYADESGVYALSATAESNNSRSNASAVLVVQPASKCFSAELKSDANANANPGEASAIKVTLKNTGTSTDSYRLSVEGAAWAYVSPSNVTLQSGVQADAYLYVNPPTSANNTNTKLTVKAISNSAAASKDITVSVGKPVAAATTATTSGSGITGAIIYDSGSSPTPFWKVAIVAAIALVIIIILVVRFVLLVK